MRNLSPASLAALQQATGLEPVIIVRVWWGGSSYTSYCDKKFETEGLLGKLLEISGIEDIVDIDSSSTSVSLTLTLDDSDGSLKQIFNTKDIHKTYVQVLQWFSNLPITEAFLIFEGEISSPVIWTEGTRTLQFDVITKLEDREIGFSAEEGQFDFIPSSLIGKAWPIVFGKVAGLKLLPLTEPPSAVLASGFGIVDEDVWQEELDDLFAAMTDTLDKARDAYQLGLINALIAGNYKQFGPLQDDPDLAAQYDEAADNYFEQAYNYGNEWIRLNLEYSAKLQDRDNQRALEYRVLPITQTNLPTGITFTVEISNYTASAVVVGNSIVLSNLAEKVDVNEKVGTNQYVLNSGVTDEYQRNFRGQKFVWIDGGTQIKVFNFPRYYIASIGSINVLNLWGTNKYGRAVVPKNWYTVEVVNYNGLVATRIVFPTPLTSYPGDWQEGDLEIDCQSLTLGTNTVDAMLWIIQNFTELTWNAASFNYVRNKVQPYPCNFALTERKNVVSFLQEVAFQSRCAIWINDRKFFIRYLPEEPAHVETIEESDIEVNSMILTSTETERLITKFTAEWRANINQSEPNKIIYRHNIKRYGTVEETYNFYIYNQYELVAKSAEFWLIRKANTWKRIQCNLMLNKLRIETFDPVLFNFNEPFIANEPITGIIEKATYDSSTDTIAIEAWLPVRLGEMHKYVYAFPFNVTAIFPSASDPNIKTGNPYEEASGELVPPITFPPYLSVQPYSGFPFTQGRGEQIGDQFDSAPTDVITALDPSEINTTRPLRINQFNNEKKYKVRPITDFVFAPVVPNTFFAYVRTKINDNLYTCDLYTGGFDQAPVSQDVKIGFIRIDSELPNGYPLVVHRTTFAITDSQGNKTTKYEYWAQPAIWVPPAEA